LDTSAHCLTVANFHFSFRVTAFLLFFKLCCKSLKRKEKKKKGISCILVLCGLMCTQILLSHVRVTFETCCSEYTQQFKSLGFYSDLTDVFVLLGSDVASLGNWFPTVRDNVNIIISNLSDDRSTASSKTIPPLTAI
jgi:uncharacterized membrane protein YfhO